MHIASSAALKATALRWLDFEGWRTGGGEDRHVGCRIEADSLSQTGHAHVTASGRVATCGVSLRGWLRWMSALAETASARLRET